MSQDRQSKLLLALGMALFLMGLITGVFSGGLKNPRSGLSAHLEGVLNGMLLILLGIIWNRIRLGPKTALFTFLLFIYGTYMNWATTLWTAVMGTSHMTPIAGAGYHGEPWQENIADAGLISVALTMLLAALLALKGLIINLTSPPHTD